MGISRMMQEGANIQIVCSLADLKEVFREWQDERDAAIPDKEDVMLTADETAKQLNVTNVTLWRWAKTGYLRPVKAGRKTFYWQSDINKLLQKEA